MISWMFLTTLAVASAASAPCPDAEELAAKLREAAAIPDPDEREAAASALARAEPSVDAWLAAIEAFPPPEARAPGPMLHQAPLFTGSKVESVPVEVYLPKGYDPATPAMTMLQLHAAGGSAAGAHALWRQVADELGMLVVAPSSAAQEIGYGFTEDERVTALSALRWASLHHAVDPRRVIVSGISRGGHMSWDLGLRHPDRFAALAPMVGGPRFATQRAQNNVRYLEQLVDMPIRDLQGARDDPALVANLHATFAQLKKWKATDAEYIEFADMGHSFRFEEVDWPAFLRRVEAEARPEQVLRCAAQAGERSHWLEVLEVDERSVSVDFGMQVSAARWNTMDEVEKRGVVLKTSLENTGKVEARRTGVGEFSLKPEGVKAVRLWLDRDSFEAGEKLQLRWKGRRKRLDVVEDASVLLTEFLDRLDPGFLPVATVEVR